MVLIGAGFFKASGVGMRVQGLKKKFQTFFFLPLRYEPTYLLPDFWEGEELNKRR